MAKYCRGQSNFWRQSNKGKVALNRCKRALPSKSRRCCFKLSRPRRNSSQLNLRDRNFRLLEANAFRLLTNLPPFRPKKKICSSLLCESKTFQENADPGIKSFRFSQPRNSGLDLSQTARSKLRKSLKIFLCNWLPRCQWLTKENL